MRFRNNWLTALIVNLIIMVLVMVFTDMSYETNDDYAISTRTLAGDPYTFFVDYHLCLFLIWLQKAIPVLNAFVLFQVCMSFVAFTCITKIFFDGDRGFWGKLLFVMVLCIFAFDQYSVVQFTKSSVLIMTAGLLLLGDSVTKKRSFPYYLIGIILFYLGTMIRFKSLAVAIGFAGLFILFWALENRRELVPRGYLKLQKILSYVVVLMLVAGSAGLYLWSGAINNSSKDLKDYQDYNFVRSEVVDYSGFSNYENRKARFDAEGLSENDLYLIDNWYFDYDGAASQDNLNKIDSIYSDRDSGDSNTLKKATVKFSKHIISAIKDHTASGIHVAILIIAALSGLVMLRPRYWPYIFAVGIATIGLYVLLYYIGRPAYRVFYGIDLAAVIWLLYYFEGTRTWTWIRAKATVVSGDGEIAGTEQATEKEAAVDEMSGAEQAAEKETAVDEIAGAEQAAEKETAVDEIADVKREKAGIMVAMALKSVFAAAMALMLAAGIFLNWQRCQSSHERIVSGLRSDEMSKYIDDNDDKVFVFASRDKKNTEPYGNPIMVPDPDENVFTFGGWGTKSPYLLDKMGAYGLENVFSDIIDNDKVYVIDSRNRDRMEEYFNKWYGAKYGNGREIKYVEAGKVGDTSLWQVVTVTAEPVSAAKSDSPKDTAATDPTN